MKSSRLDYVETIRGLACLLLVSYHAIGANASLGLKLPDDHFLRLSNEFLRDARMPIFSFISGFVFSAIVLSWSQWGDKVGSKARRLLIPMIFVGTIQYLMYVGIGREQIPYYEIFYKSYQHFWFLQATFLLMVLHLTFSKLLGSTTRSALALWVVGTASYIIFGYWDYPIFSSDDAMYLSPFFFAGFLIKSQIGRVDALAVKRMGSPVLIAVAVFLGLMLMRAYYLSGGFTMSEQVARSVQVLTGLSAAWCLFMVRPVNAFLMRIGNYSYAIFLFHVICAAVARMVLMRLFPEVDRTLFYPVILFAGVAGPIMAQHLILRSATLSLLLLGIDKKKTNKPTVPTAFA